MLSYVPSLNGDPRDCDRRCLWGRERRPGARGQEGGLLFTENSLYCLNFFYHSPCAGSNGVPLPLKFMPTPNLRIGPYLEIGSSLMQSSADAIILGGPKIQWLVSSCEKGDLDRHQEDTMWRQRHTGRTLCDNSGRDGRDASISWKAKDSQQLPEAGKGKIRFSPRVSGKSVALPTPRFQTSDLQNYKRIHSCWFNSPSYISPRKLIQTLIFLTHGLDPPILNETFFHYPRP